MEADGAELSEEQKFHQLAHRHGKDLARLSIIKKLAPLEDLTVRNILDNLEYFLTKHEPFHHLALPFLAMLQRSEDGWKLMAPCFAPLVITPVTRHLVLDFDVWEERLALLPPWSSEDLDRIIDLIGSTCTRLRSLVVRGRQWFRLYVPATPPITLMSAEQLQRLVSACEGLEELHFHYCEVDDSLLEVVVERHHKSLKCLEILERGELPAEGLLHVSQTCRKLETLRLSCFDFTEKALLESCQTLPNFKHIEVEDMSTFYLSVTAGMIEMAKNHDPEAPPLLLKGHSFTLWSNHSIDEETLERVLRTFPLLDDVGISQQGPPAILDVLLRAKNPFRHFLIQDTDVLQLVPRFSSTLTRLEINLDTPVDPSILGQCTNLVTLCVSSPLTPVCEHPVEEDHFQRLDTLMLENCPYDVVRLPDRLMVQILSGPRLMHIVIEGLVLSQKVIEQLAARARSGLGALQSLRSVEFNPEPSVTVDWMAALASNAPRLRFIRCELADSAHHRNALLSFSSYYLPNLRWGEIL